MKVGFVAILPDDASGHVTGPTNVSINLLRSLQEVSKVQVDLLHRLGSKTPALRVVDLIRTLYAVLYKRYNVILFSGFAPKVSLLLTALCKSIGTETVYLAHGLVFLEKPEAHAKVFQERLLLRLVDRVVAFSDIEKTLIVERYPQLAQQITIIPHGVPSAFLCEQSVGNVAIREPSVLYVGRRTLAKGTVTLIRALEALDPPPMLVIAGSPGDADPWIFASPLYSQGLIRLLGKVTQGELKTLYQKSLVFVLPSFYSHLGW